MSSYITKFYKYFASKPMNDLNVGFLIKIANIQSFQIQLLYIFKEFLFYKSINNNFKNIKNIIRALLTTKIPASKNSSVNSTHRLRGIISSSANAIAVCLEQTFNFLSWNSVLLESFPNIPRRERLYLRFAYFLIVLSENSIN